MVSSLLWCSGFHDQFYSALQYVDIHFSGMTRAAAHSTSILTSPVTKITNDRFSIIFFETPLFSSFDRIYPPPSCGTIVGQARSWDARVPRSFSLISFVPDWNHNNDGLVCGAELRGLAILPRTSGSSASRSGPYLVRVVKASRQSSFGDWRGHGACTAFTSFGREKLTTAGRKIRRFRFFLFFVFLVFGIISLCTWCGC